MFNVSGIHSLLDDFFTSNNSNKLTSSNSVPSTTTVKDYSYASTSKQKDAEIPSFTPGIGYERSIAACKTHRERKEISLVPVSEIPEKYQCIFSFPYFNYMQSMVFEDVFYTDKTLVVCAPTGSGKTAVFELAILRLLMKIDETNNQYYNYKIVYLAPIKALCNERYDDWKRKFDPLGVFCVQLTGDSDSDDYFQLQKFTIILTTPEKWNSLTRKWRGNKKLMEMVKLFFIDEIHLLNENERGATLEATLSRMKTIQSVLCNEDNENIFESLRFVSASATFPNAEDIVDWLSPKDSKGVTHQLNDEIRPVPLQKIVLGYAFRENWSEYRFELSLNYKLPNVISTYSDNKPTLIFCSTRKSVVQAATSLAKEIRYVFGQSHKEVLIEASATIKDAKLKGVLLCGIGFHHAGLDISDRRTVEQLFLHNRLFVLISTSTLAMGVNFPAHLVIVKSTTQYVSGCYKEYTETQLLQMIGRAGRPQFDSSATAVIMTKHSLKEKYQSLLNGTATIESSLHKYMIEHLNAEIVLGSIRDVSVAIQWLKSTFLYIRVFRNPKHYGISPSLPKDIIEKRLQGVFEQEIRALSEHKLVMMTDGFYLQPTEIGRLMSKYYMTFETMKKFSVLKGNESLPELLNVISGCKELEDIQLRVNEKKILNQFNKNNQSETIRFPFPGKIKNRAMKINCLVQAVFGCLPIYDAGLNQDVSRICMIGSRIAQCLSGFLSIEMRGFTAVYNALILAKCFKVRLWENSKYISRQIERIGNALSNVLVNASLTSFEAICQTNPRELEMILNRNPPFGSNVIESVAHLPSYCIAIQQIDGYSQDSASLLLTVSITNLERLQKKCTAPNHSFSFIVGDADNKILLQQQIMDKHILKMGRWTKKLTVKRASEGDEIYVHLISDHYVGLDVQDSYKPYYNGLQRTSKENPYEDFSIQPSKNTAKTISRTFGETRPKVSKTCNHKCRGACGHSCCKGVGSVASKVKSHVKSHADFLNKQSSDIPSKCLKLQNQGKFDYSVGLDELAEMFAYSSKSSYVPFHSGLNTTTCTRTSESKINETGGPAVSTTEEPDNRNLLHSSEVTEQPPARVASDYFCKKSIYKSAPGAINSKKAAASSLYNQKSTRSYTREESTEKCASNNSDTDFDFEDFEHTPSVVGRKRCDTYQFTSVRKDSSSAQKNNKLPSSSKVYATDQQPLSQVSQTKSAMDKTGAVEKILPDIELDWFFSPPPSNRRSTFCDQTDAENTLNSILGSIFKQSD